MADRFALSYSAGSPKARPFLSLSFIDAEARQTSVERASARRCHPELIRTLHRQSERFLPSDARLKNMRALEEPGTVAVVTGQQVGLFLGPLYTLYKAATAVRVARALEAETGVRTVPVFWLQTEDHDFEEIATCHVPHPDRTSRALSVPSVGDDRVSVAHRRFDSSVEHALVALAEEVENLPHGEVHLRSLRTWYRPEASVAGSFAGMIATLFADEGLIVLDPRDAGLSEAMRRVHSVAIEKAAPIARALADRVEALKAADFGAPVHIREGAPLSFFHPDGPEGPRYRLEPSEGGAFTLVGRSGDRFTAQELLARLDRDPLAFSTSALLRPIFQDVVLPTCAYIAGPGEIDYFAQIGPAYDPFRVDGLHVPLIVPRAHFVLLEPKTVQSLQQLGVSAAELDQPEEALLQRQMSLDDGFVSPGALRTELLAGFDRRLTEVEHRTSALGSGLDKAISKTRSSVERSVDRFIEKYRNALAHRDESRVAELRRVMRFVRPEGSLQERHFGLSYFAARYGERALVQRVLEESPLFASGMRELRL